MKKFLIIILLLILVIPFFLFKGKKLDNLVSKDIDDVLTYLDENKINYELNYEYSDKTKDTIIKQSVSENTKIRKIDKLVLTISKGSATDTYKKYNVKLNLNEIHSEIIKVDNSFYNSKYQINNNDIVMNLTSENYDDLGKCIIVKNSENKPFLAGMETHLIKIHSSSIIPEYLNYYFESDSFLKCIQQFITGMKVFRVKPTDILNIDISLPNLQYQQHIVDIITYLKFLLLSLPILDFLLINLLVHLIQF